MKHILLDPNMYCYTNDEWSGGIALERLDGLLQILSEVDQAEKNIEASNSVKFIVPDCVLTASFEGNPVINNPPNGHYHKIYMQRVLPSLMRRRDLECNTTPVENNVAAVTAIVDCVVPDEFHEALECIDLSAAASTVFVFHPQRCSIAGDEDQHFYDIVSVNDVPGRYYISPLSVFPIENKDKAEQALSEAIYIYLERVRRADQTWNSHKPCGIVFHPDFRQSISTADFRNNSEIYHDRILYAILQISTGRNLTVNEHSMKPQKIAYDGKNHGKWNAYVFQNGPNDRDTRCSRLYFAKIDGGLLLFRYEQDAH